LRRRAGISGHSIIGNLFPDMPTLPGHSRHLKMSRNPCRIEKDEVPLLLIPNYLPLSIPVFLTERGFENGITRS
jgi:hypothetical protein